MPNENPMIAYANVLHEYGDAGCGQVKDLQEQYLNDKRRNRDVLTKRFSIMNAIHFLTMALSTTYVVPVWDSKKEAFVRIRVPYSPSQSDENHC